VLAWVVQHRRSVGMPPPVREQGVNDRVAPCSAGTPIDRFSVTRWPRPWR
jgi:hypothetical protein